jgi:hypothetical protein
MPDIDIDLDLLERIVGDLGVVSRRFSDAQAMSNELATYTGHPGLESTVRDFASKWNIHREQIIKKLTFVLDSTTAIHDTFVELEKRLATEAEKIAKEG